MATTSFSVEGMYCDHCSKMIKKSLEMVRGVESAEVTRGQAVISYDDSIVSIDDLVQAVTRFGYKVKL